MDILISIKIIFIILFLLYASYIFRWLQTYEEHHFGLLDCVHNDWVVFPGGFALISCTLQVKLLHYILNVRAHRNGNMQYNSFRVNEPLHFMTYKIARLLVTSDGYIDQFE